MALVRSASGRMPSEADFEAVMESLREKLKKRGAQGIRGLARNFKICDRDGSRSLDVQELAKCCSMCKLGLSLEEVRTLHGFFDRGGDGYISFDEFLKAIRGSLSPTRRKLVTKVFNALDASGDQNGYLTIEDLQHAYSADEHPDVKGGRRTEKEVLLDLLEVFEGSGSDSTKATSKATPAENPKICRQQPMNRVMPIRVPAKLMVISVVPRGRRGRRSCFQPSSLFCT